MLCIDNPTVAAAFMTAHAADLERFGPPDAEFDIWCKLDAWTVEEAVALSMGREPFAISPQVIKNLGLIPHKHGVKTSEDLQRLSRIAGAYEARHRALLRAARHAKLPAKLIDGAYEITPLDFLAWFERPRGEAPWQVLPVAMVEHVRAFHGRESPPATLGIAGAKETVEQDTEKEKAGRSSLGVLKDKKGVAESLKLMRSELRKPLDKRQFRTMEDLRFHCQAEFGITFHHCVNVARIANNEPGSIPYPKGRPRKSMSA